MHFYIILSVRLRLPDLSFHYACGPIPYFFHVQHVTPKRRPRFFSIFIIILLFVSYLFFSAQGLFIQFKFAIELFK